MVKKWSISEKMVKMVKNDVLVKFQPLSRSDLEKVSISSVFRGHGKVVNFVIFVKTVIFMIFVFFVEKV